MSNIYIGLALSLFVVFLAYFILSKLLLLVICALFAGLYFKNDLIVFRYVEFHVASFYLWICENCRSIQAMYHQSNNTNYTPRYEENNGSISDKFEKLLQHRLKARPITANANNLNRSSPCVQPQPQPLTSSTIWNSASLSSATTSTYKRSAIMDSISRLSQNQYKVSSDLVIKDMSNVQRPSQSLIKDVEMVERKGESARSSAYSPMNDSTRSVDRQSPKQSPALDVKLYANVNSPGFCSRVAEEINETMTHQPQYNTVGSFPRVNLNNQSQPKKIRIPVRVRLAPPTSNVFYSNAGSSSMSRSPLSGPDDSMKSVLQVLKEISRKRIHSHIDEDLEDQSKRLRYTESQFMADSTAHTSLLQQTIQGKRAREDSSPTEDVKKKRKPSVNNEISASLSSSLMMKSPKVDSAKRKRKARALDDSVSTPVLGKLLKVQKEIVPPPTTAVSTPAPTVQPIKEVSVDEVMIEVGPAPATPTPTPTPTPSDEDQPSSRLLGRFSRPERPSTPIPIPARPKDRDQFSAVNDLGLSPPKENRLAAMIAVLGGPADLDVLTSQKTPEVIKGKALFTTPETPESPKQNKKVTFSEHLTMTKVFERDDTDSSKSSAAPTPQVPVLNFSSPVAPILTSSSLTTSPLGFSPFSSTVGESAKQKEVASTVVTTSSTVSSPSQNVTTQPTLNFLSNSISSPAAVSSSNAVSVSGSESNFFSFGSNSSPQRKPEEAPKPITSASSMFSFGNVKTVESQSTNAPLFGNTKTDTDISKPAPTPEVTSNVTTNQNSSFSIFTSKNSPSLTPISKAESQKPITDGYPQINSASPFASLQKPEDSKISSPFASVQKPEETKSTFPAFGTNAISSSVFSFGSSTPAVEQPTPQNTSSTQSNPLMFSAKNSTVSKPTPSAATTQPMNIFGNAVAVATSTQSKPFAFGSQNSSSPAFGATGSSISGDTIKPAFAAPTTTQSNTVNLFGNPATTQSNSVNLFGNPATNPTITNFGGSAMSQTPPIPTFGTTAGANQSNSSPFGIALSNSTPTTQSSNMFGASTFGNATTSSTTPSQSTMFNSGSASTQQSKPLFGSTNPPSFGATNSNVPPAFGSQNSSAPSPFGNSNSTVQSFGNPSAATLNFGSQSNTPTFGAQTTTSGFLTQNTTLSFGAQTTAPSFGTQNSTTSYGTPNNPPSFGTQNTQSFGTSNNTPTFGNQNTTMSFVSQNANTFGASGPFSQVNSTTVENKPPPAFGSPSPFMFGNSTNKEPAKPFAAAAPFNFGSNSQPAANSNPAFGSTNAFGNGLPPAFGATAQPATGGFNFNASPSMPTFQFNAAVSQSAPGKSALDTSEQYNMET